MKKRFKKFLATAFASMLALTAFGASVPTIVKAAEESTESYRVFVAFGGDAEAENDWGLSYAGGDVTGDITATDGEIKVGDTVTVGLEFANPVVNVWYVAPTIVAEKVVSADFDVKVKIDGEEVDADLTKGDNWWYEETGDFKKDQAVRVAGGFNEWGTQYIAEPSGFTKIEFEITAKSIQVGDAAVENATESTETYPMYLAFGGDKAEENDWALSYDGETASEGITATDAEIKVGETAKVKLEFAEPVFNAWYFAPFIVGENIVDADFTVKAYVDGTEVDLDMTQGDNWWYEATGSYDDKHAVRIAGGFNEWGAQYMAEPSGFTTLEFEVTANKIMVGAPEEKAQSSAGPVDLDGTYHAYIGFQTPKYTFRNAYSEPNYGFGKPEFDQVTGWGEDNEELVVEGTLHDAEIKGNGTYTVSVNGLQFAEDEFADQQYMNLIFISTDIPNTDEITISDVVLKINGSEVSDVNAILNEEDVDYVDIHLQNIYNDEIKTIGYYPVDPLTDIEITFTVSGFNYDNDGSSNVTEAGDDVTEAPEVITPQKTTPPVGLIIGIVCGVLVVVGLVVFFIVKGKKK